MITLVPFTTPHFPILKQWINSAGEEQMFLWAGPTFQFPLTDEQLKSYVKEKNAYIFSVLSEKNIIGHVALRKIDYVHHTARIGKLFLAPSFRGNGYTPQILLSILHTAFNNLKLNEVTIGVFQNNPHAKYIYKKFGFKTIQLLPSHLKVNGNSWDLAEMSLLKHDFDSICRTMK